MSVDECSLDQSKLFLCHRKCKAWNQSPPTYVDAHGSIAPAYGMETMVGEGGREWESAKMKPRGTQTEGSIPTDI